MCLTNLTLPGMAGSMYKLNIHMCPVYGQQVPSERKRESVREFRKEDCAPVSMASYTLSSLEALLSVYAQNATPPFQPMSPVMWVHLTLTSGRILGAYVTMIQVDMWEVWYCQQPEGPLGRSGRQAYTGEEACSGVPQESH